MVRTTGSSGIRTLASVREAGVELIYTHGYEAMTLRMLASAVGVQPASLYKYFDTKQGLLFALLRDHLEALNTALAEALPDGGTAAHRLDAFVTFHVAYHMERKREVSLANFELRSLSDENKPAIVALRRAYEAPLIAILEDGVAEGAFVLADSHVTAFAMLSMLTGVCTWYDRHGPRQRDEIIAMHLAMARGMVGLAPGTDVG
ncbi:TetR/AcrR family transcriptional regulator [Sphingobium sufflavum]|uniref:TetR/AcrR family transcriptional regulator n=1 Tax=Sphingobium sufflavum TaxID=1129547 RepID=UPI001F23299E|nr:TetR/AcrR family transcriptional regulator [Sphingobium sufflavum]MCE7795696.1 TetR/AcrR family transcriptional regulator [Sphingobium sufflavum]